MAKKSNRSPLAALTHYPNDERFVKRIWELMKQVEHNATYALTPFFRPDKQQMVRQLAGKQYLIKEDGFYEAAEAKRMAICDPYEDNDIDFGICQLVAHHQSKFVQVTHQDVLGAMMQLGMEREQFGDIAINEAQIGIVVSKSQANYVSTNLTKIHRLSVHWEVSDHPVIANQQSVLIDIIVSSLRLDTLVGALTTLSRTKAKETIVSGLVKVNHSCIENAEKVCHNKDIISIRGYGRYQIDEIKGTTKKGNMAVAIRQFK